jgi:hypothetical protein
MSTTAQALVNGARKTNGIYEMGERTLRMLAAALISGQYDGKPAVAPAPRGI